MRVRPKQFFSYCVVVAVVFVVHTSLLFSQDVAVTAAVDSTHITMGDWLNLTVNVKHDNSVTVAWSQFRDTLGAFEIIRQDSIERDESDGAIIENKKFTLSKYDSGSFVIPPILIAYKHTNDTTLRYVHSDPLTIQVSSVQLDTTKGIKDVKPPLSIPLTWKEITLYAGIFLAFAALMYGVFYYYRKRKKQGEEIIEDVAPKIPPHIQAIAQLKELQEKRVWQQGNVKAFYSEATEIIRQYFEGRYGVMALEMTSDEIFGQLKRFALDASIMKLIEFFFINADLVKFAKYMPTPSENEAVIPQALDIVERTKPIVEVPQNV